MNTYSPAATVEEDFVNLVKLELNDIKRSFFSIGFRLREANSEKYYLKLGFDSIEECAEELFGFGKTTTYDLMRIAYLYKNDKAPMSIDPRYEKYSQSQLVLFSQINMSPQNFIHMASPGDSISTLKKAKSYWNMLQRGKLQSFLGYGRCKNITEFIQKVEECNPDLVTKSREQEKIIIEENSGYPEKHKDIIIEDLSDVIEEPVTSEWDKTLYQHLIPACEKFLKHMSYKTIFDPDNKGMGVRVEPDLLAEQMVLEMLETFDNNRTVIKTKFKKYIKNGLSEYNYEIILNGRKQGLEQFCGNIASFIMDLFNEEYQQLKPKEKKAKKK